MELTDSEFNYIIGAVATIIGIIVGSFFGYLIITLYKICRKEKGEDSLIEKKSEEAISNNLTNVSL